MLHILRHLTKACFDGQFTFSQTDRLLLYNYRFYDKVMRGLTSVSAIEALGDLAVAFVIINTLRAGSRKHVLFRNHLWMPPARYQ